MSSERDHAFVLHTRAYRDTSLLVDALSMGYGRVSMLARGAKRPKSAWRGLLRPFQPLLVEWSGQGDLKTLKLAEADGAPIALKGNALISGFYLNELLTRLLYRYDPHPEVFELYQKTLPRLIQGMLEPSLREFELTLLQFLGYQVDFNADAAGLPLEPERIYRFDSQQGWQPVPETIAAEQPVTCFRGNVLARIGRYDWRDPETLTQAKQLCRLALRPHLGDKPLMSRRYFQT